MNYTHFVKNFCTYILPQTTALVEWKTICEIKTYMFVEIFFFSVDFTFKQNFGKIFTMGLTVVSVKDCVWEAV